MHSPDQFCEPCELLVPLSSVRRDLHTKCGAVIACAVAIEGACSRSD